MDEKKLITEQLAYPASPVMKYIYRTPILLYRLGLGFIVGHLFMIMTTWGRKSGLPRRTAIEFHEFQGRKYVMVGWERSDWYQNLQANPLLTIQTAKGIEHVRARRLTSDDDLNAAWDAAEHSPFIQAAVKLTGANLTRESFLAQRDRFILLTFDPTDEPTPPPLEADLLWVNAFVASVLVGLWLARRRARCLSRSA
ncbi:MAG: nitroreductase family deazaflavin-dependent oxidoreductase [Aggregatilineales bacterium]